MLRLFTELFWPYCAVLRLATGEELLLVDEQGQNFRLIDQIPEGGW
jgi:hypothetical protein